MLSSCLGLLSNDYKREKCKDEYKIVTVWNNIDGDSKEAIQKLDENGNNVYQEEKKWLETKKAKYKKKRTGSYTATSPYSGAPYEFFVHCK